MHRPAAPHRRRRATASVAALVAAVTACGSGDDSATDGGLLVVTTVAPITSIVAAVVGDHARVVGVVPEGTDSHTFEPDPSAAELLARADVVYLNGLQLEEPTKRLADAHVDPAAIVELGDRTLSPDEFIYDDSFPRAGGKPNPHLWTDPILAGVYASIVADDMAARDPANALSYAANADAFGDLVEELDAAMRSAFATIPKADLLTYHDAYAYVARRYGLNVIGAIQAVDMQEPTAAHVVGLIEQIRAVDVPAIFGSEVFPSPVLEQISRETDTVYVDDLRDDDLPGAPDDPAHSWLGLMLFNYITITEALGGDASSLRALDPAAMPTADAAYPQ